MKHKAVLLVASIIALASVPARAALTQIEGGGVATQASGVNSKALEAVQQAATQGGKLAETTLGVMYDRGQGVPRDYEVAARWFRKAAEQGSECASHTTDDLHFLKTAARLADCGEGRF